MIPKYKTGQEKFYEKYSYWPKLEREEVLGVGAVCDSNLIDRIKMEDKK
jgi:hypothetical protein